MAALMAVRVLPRPISSATSARPLLAMTNVTASLWKGARQCRTWSGTCPFRASSESSAPSLSAASLPASFWFFSSAAAIILRGRGETWCRCVVESATCSTSCALSGNSHLHDCQSNRAPGTLRRVAMTSPPTRPASAVAQNCLELTMEKCIVALGTLPGGGRPRPAPFALLTTAGLSLRATGRCGPVRMEGGSCRFFALAGALGASDVRSITRFISVIRFGGCPGQVLCTL
mmetsp:Transcript_24947/g.55343  ORF Transcript_24947/g.55343 Transcript_24947/m.55343 type:complete len:231 (-) Transcript_24947:154-846(-)